MLKSILEWNRRRKEWNAQHTAAWADAITRDDDGLSLMQRVCEARLGEELATIGSQLTERAIEDAPMAPWIRARIDNSALSIWFHDDTAGLDAPKSHNVFEHWDYRTPEELAKALCEAVIAAVQERRKRAV